MSEAVSAVCRKMKKYRTPYRVNLCIDNKNKKSLRVAQKCGFDWKDTCFTNIYSLVPPRHEKFLNNTIEKIFKIPEKIKYLNYTYNIALKYQYFIENIKYGFIIILLF